MHLYFVLIFPRVSHFLLPRTTDFFVFRGPELVILVAQEGKCLLLFSPGPVALFSELGFAYILFNSLEFSGHQPGA